MNHLFFKKIQSQINVVSIKSNIYLYWISFLFLFISIYRLLNFRIDIFFLNSKPAGDEGLFIESFNYFIAHGWYKSVAIGSSPIFNLFAFPFYLITKDVLISFKLLNIFCLVAILIIWTLFLIKHLKTDREKLVLFILFLIQISLMQNTFFSGYNDGLFALLITLGFIYLYNGIKEANKVRFYFILSGIFFSLSLAVRELFLIYIPGLSIIFFITFIKNRMNSRHIFKWLISFFMLTILIHYPAISEMHSLSMLDKNPKGINNVTWAERNYLMVVNNSKTRPTWEEVLEYKKIHGENSLPKKITEAIFLNPYLIFKFSIRQIYLSQLQMIRKLGFFYVFIISNGLFLFWRKEFWKSFLWIPLFFYAFFNSILCFIIMTNLEFRWLIVFPFLLSIFSFIEIAKIIKNDQKVESIIYLNVIIIAIANIMMIGIW